jgi:KaiC/GvpD/RAD55 family RecA-like ATPase
VQVQDEDAKADVRQDPVSPFIDWPVFWASEDEEQEWVWRNVLARGRGHAIYAMHKGGKSLLTLYMAAEMATSGYSCLYLDYEMTAADVRERLRDMGYGPESDLSHLYYALLPTMPPLDSEEGGIALAELVDAIAEKDPGRHVVTVIDTISRAVWGEENSADTWRLFYVHTGLRLKQRGVTWLRLDHGGKDAGKGQRGSSGKGDDVDVVWKLAPTENGIRLTRELARMNWVPETVSLLMQDFPLCYMPAVSDWPEGTAALANLMDRMDLPLKTSVRAAGEKLREIDEGRRHDLVSAALKFRKERSAEMPEKRGEQRGEHYSAIPAGITVDDRGEQASFSLGNSAGNAGEQGSRVSGEQSPPIYRGTVTTPAPESPDDMSKDVDSETGEYQERRP